jgi:hypothetical protein
MVHIEEFTVANPASSEEVRERALGALGSRAGEGVLQLVLRPDQEVPAATDVAVSFLIQVTTHFNDSEGSGLLSGNRVAVNLPEDGSEPTITPLPGTVTVRLAADPEQPATASMTVED